MFIHPFFFLFTLLVVPCVVWAGSIEALITGNQHIANMVNQYDADVKDLTGVNALPLGLKIQNEVANLGSVIRTLYEENQGLSPSNNEQEARALVNTCVELVNSVVLLAKDIMTASPMLKAAGLYEDIVIGLQNLEKPLDDLSNCESSLVESLLGLVDGVLGGGGEAGILGNPLGGAGGATGLLRAILGGLL